MQKLLNWWNTLTDLGKKIAGAAVLFLLCLVLFTMFKTSFLTWWQRATTFVSPGETVNYKPDRDYLRCLQKNIDPASVSHCKTIVCIAEKHPKVADFCSKNKK